MKSMFSNLQSDRPKVSRRRFLKTVGATLGVAAVANVRFEKIHAQNAGVEPAPNMPAPKYIDTNGIRMAYYEQGEGFPVIFCHGFPELAYSWRNQIKAFSEAGFRAIAPDQRGYGLTGGPEDPKLYTMAHLCGDLVGLLDALGIDKAVFCGHDWGGGVVWMMPRLYPERVAGVIGVNTPTSGPPGSPRAPQPEPLIIMSPNYYVASFQKPGVAEAALSKDVRKTFEFILRKGGIWNVEEFKRLPEDSPERQMDLLAMLEKGDFLGELLLPDNELDYFVETFEATGFTGGLNWYRNLGAGFGGADLKWEIDVPCLYIGAENDVILRPSSANGMENFIADLEKYTVMDCGHWTQQEKPEEFNRVALDWLRRKFPSKT